MIDVIEVDESRLQGKSHPYRTPRPDPRRVVAAVVGPMNPPDVAERGRIARPAGQVLHETGHAERANGRMRNVYCHPQLLSPGGAEVFLGSFREC